MFGLNKQTPRRIKKDPIVCNLTFLYLHISCFYQYYSNCNVNTKPIFWCFHKKYNFLLLYNVDFPSYKVFLSFAKFILYISLRPECLWNIAKLWQMRHKKALLANHPHLASSIYTFLVQIFIFSKEIFTFLPLFIQYFILLCLC